MRIAAFLLMFMPLFSGGVLFPGPKQCISPDKRYAISWEEPSKELPEHQLILEEKSSKTKIYIYQFGRSVQVTWSPDSKHFAITDHLGSNLSEVVVVSAAEPTKRTSIPIPKSIKNEIADHGHVYLEFNRWLSKSRLRLTVKAHDSNSTQPYKGAFEYVLSEK